MIKDCKNCKSERREYGAMYCVSCWNSGGRERDNKVRNFGIEIVEDDERIWRERGFIINYKTGRLERLLSNETRNVIRPEWNKMQDFIAETDKKLESISVCNHCGGKMVDGMCDAPLSVAD